MATKIAYIKVRIVIENDKVDNITDEDINDVISATNYQFDNVGDFKIETEICGINE